MNDLEGSAEADSFVAVPDDVVCVLLVAVVAILVAVVAVVAVVVVFDESVVDP